MKYFKKSKIKSIEHGVEHTKKLTLRPAILFMTCSVTYFQVKIKVWSWSKNSGVMQSPTPSLPLFCYLIYECSLNKTVIDKPKYLTILSNFVGKLFPFWVWFKCSVVFVSLKFSNFHLFKCCWKKKAFRCTWISYWVFWHQSFEQGFSPTRQNDFSIVTFSFWQVLQLYVF